jgi:hypothetical protein
MNLTARFALVASGDVVRLTTLDEGRRYPVTFAQRKESQYGPSILLTLRNDPTSNVKEYLPKRFTEVFQDGDIEHINTETRSYHLVYHGRYPNSRSFKLTLEN